MSLYKHIRQIWKKPKENLKEVYKDRLIKWRKEPVTVRIDKPTRLDRARSLGYKAKQGIIVVRQRVMRGSHKRPKIKGGRRPRNSGIRKNLSMSYKLIAEQRAFKKYKNCEVLNSYYVADDGKYLWYEIILVDKLHPAIISDKNLKWLNNPANKNRVLRGLTSSAKKSRGLRSKGIGAEKVRPSRTANKY
ncbi:MAG: 50S ribosomal protein L15e [Nanoarchaeota archaeon]